MSRAVYRSIALSLAVLAGACTGGGEATADERRACERVSRLCNGGEADARECARGFVDMRTTGGGEENSRRTIRCIDEANTCGGVSGCVAGGGARSGANFLKDFIDSFTR